MQSEKTVGGRDFHERPDEQGDPRGWDNEGLDDEQPPDLLRRNEHERELDCPVNEVAHNTYFVRLQWTARGIGSVWDQETYPRL